MYLNEVFHILVTESPFEIGAGHDLGCIIQTKRELLERLLENEGRPRTKKAWEDSEDVLGTVPGTEYI